MSCTASDYPCWEPAEALELISKIDLSEADKQKLFVDNVKRIFRLARSGEAGRAGNPRWCDAGVPPAGQNCPQPCLPGWRVATADLVLSWLGWT